MLKISWKLTASFVAFLSLAACTRELEREVQIPHEKGVVEHVTTISVASSTRFKNTPADRTHAASDGKSICAVPAGTAVVLKAKAVLVADHKHVFASLAKPLPQCGMMEGYFFGEHLYGSNWMTKVDPASINNPQGAVSEQVENKVVAPDKYDAAWGQKIAKGVKYVPYTTGQCYRYVAYHLEDAGVINYYDPAWDNIGDASAYMFGEWASLYPGTLKSKFGLKRSAYFSNNPSQAPIGTVLVYDRGVCGYSSAHGHIEIVVSPGKACSDFCQSIAPASCGKPRAFIPVGR